MLFLPLIGWRFLEPQPLELQLLYHMQVRAASVSNLGRSNFNCWAILGYQLLYICTEYENSKGWSA